MKKIVIMTLLGMLMISTASAFTDSDVNKDAAKMLTQVMNEEFELTDKQINKVYKINLKYIKKNLVLKQSELGQFYKLGLLNVYHIQKSNELKAILSQEQFSKYEQLIESIKQEYIY